MNDRVAEARVGHIDRCPQRKQAIWAAGWTVRPGKPEEGWPPRCAARVDGSLLQKTAGSTTAVAPNRSIVPAHFRCCLLKKNVSRKAKLRDTLIEATTEDAQPKIPVHVIHLALVAHFPFGWVSQRLPRHRRAPPWTWPIPTLKSR